MTQLLIRYLLISIVVLFVARKSAADDRQIVLVPIDGPTATVELIDWNKTFLKVRRDGEVLQFPVTDLLRFDLLPAKDTPNVPPSVSPSQDRVLIQFTNGDALFVDQIEIFDDALHIFIHKSKTSQWEIPIEFVSGILFPVVESLRIKPLKTLNADVVFPINRDRLSGEVRSIRQDRLSMKTVLGIIEIPTWDIERIQFNPQLSQKPTLPEQAARLTLHDGSSLTVTNAELNSQGDLSFTDLHGNTGQWGIREIRRCEFLTPQLQSLTKLAPVAIKTESYFGTPFTVQTNHTGTITIPSTSGVPMARGFSTRSRSELVFAIPEKAERFISQVGFDDHAGGQGGVILRILLDDETIWERPLLPDDGLIDVEPLSLKDARQISLIVDFGPKADIQDVVNWMSPTFVLAQTASGSKTSE